MDRVEMEEILRQTLADTRMTRTERRALSEVLIDEDVSSDELAWIRSRAFDLAREHVEAHQDRLVLDWLEELVRVITSVSSSRSRPEHAEAYFTPGADGPARIVDLLDGARRSVEICVFTITDNRLAQAIESAHRRRVAVRIITDDDKALDRGSDVDRLHDVGVPVRTDRSEHHMHHKFAIFDNELLLTGSYNWTRSAAGENQENFIVIEEPRLISAFSRTFEALWERFGLLTTPG